MTLKRIFISVIALVFSITLFPSQADAVWILDDFFDEGDEIVNDLTLVRVDYEDPDCPLHETTEGVYGIFDVNEVFYPVLDFSKSPAIQAPFESEDVHWVPGPLDKE
ncbi:hypothetical protein ACFLQV_01720 [Calditrichota bacterium]